MPLKRPLRLDQGPRALVAFGMLGQIGADQVADREHFGGRPARLLAFHGGVATVARRVDGVGGLAPYVVELQPRDRPQGQPLPLAVRRGVPDHERSLAGPLDPNRQPRASGVKVEHLGLARWEGQTLEVALRSEGHRDSLSLGPR